MRNNCFRNRVEDDQFASAISPRRRRHDPQVLHHALVPVLDDMAMQHEISNEALVACSQHRLIAALQRHAVAPLAAKARVVRIVCRAFGVDDVQAISVADRNLDDLERVDMDVKRVADEAGLQCPLPHPAERQDAVDRGRIVGFSLKVAGSKFFGRSLLPTWNFTPPPLMSMKNTSSCVPVSSSSATSGCGTKRDSFRPSRRSAMTVERIAWAASCAAPRRPALLKRGVAVGRARRDRHDRQQIVTVASARTLPAPGSGSLVTQ